MPRNMTNPSVITDYMNRQDFFFKKNLGQNFLRDENVARKITEELDFKDTDVILEIGPGFGALTQFLVENASKVIAVEIDPFAISVLNDAFSDCSNLEIVRGDVLRTDIAQMLGGYAAEGKTLKAISNLPYYITSQVIMKLLTSGVRFEKIVIMVQKEVSDRLAAEKGTKDYSAFTVLLNYYAVTEKRFDVSHTNFIPQPKVDSTVMTVTPLTEHPVSVSDEDRFIKTVKAAFAMRRKTLLNNISAGFDISKDEARERIEKAGFDPAIRGEILSLQEFAALSECMPS